MRHYQSRIRMKTTKVEDPAEDANPNIMLSNDNEKSIAEFRKRLEQLLTPLIKLSLFTCFSII